MTCNGRADAQAEVDAMVALVDDAMGAGAIGVSSNYADNDEHGVPRAAPDCRFRKTATESVRKCGV